MVEEKESTMMKIKHFYRQKNGEFEKFYLPPAGCSLMLLLPRSQSADLGRCNFRLFRKSMAFDSMRNGFLRSNIEDSTFLKMELFKIKLISVQAHNHAWKIELERRSRRSRRNVRARFLFAILCNTKTTLSPIPTLNFPPF